MLLNANNFRVVLSGMKVERVNENAKYFMIQHERDKMNPINPCRLNILDRVNSSWRVEGLNSLAYKIIKKETQPLFTWIFVDQLEIEARANLTAQKIC